MKIEVLFPEVCNLYGDLANIRYLAESMQDVEVVETSLKEKPCFATGKVDLIYMGTTTEEGIRLSVEALLPYKDILTRLIDDGQFIFLTGNALDVFGKYIDTDQDLWRTDDANKSPRHLDCLGIIDTYSKYRMMNRHNSFYVGTLNDDDAAIKNGGEDVTVVGFKSIFGHTFEMKNAQVKAEKGNDMTFFPTPLFRTVRGVGRNPEVTEEGYRINNLMATYLIGPILPLNPKFTKWLLVEMLETGIGGITSELDEKGEPKITVAYEEAATIAYEQRLSELMNEHFDPIY